MKFSFLPPKQKLITLERSVHFSWNPIHPKNDWRKLLCVFTILVIGVIGWSAYLFHTSSDASDGADALVSVKEKSKSSERLGRIEGFFEKRVAERAAAPVPMPEAPASVATSSTSTQVIDPLE